MIINEIMFLNNVLNLIQKISFCFFETCMITVTHAVCANRAPLQTNTVTLTLYAKSDKYMQKRNIRDKRFTQSLNSILLYLPFSLPFKVKEARFRYIALSHFSLD